jgi:hypothetical protein
MGDIMSVANNRTTVRAVKVKGLVFFSLMAFLMLVSLAPTKKVQAAITVPYGFRQITSGTGVRVFEKTYSTGKPDYVVVVDLRYGTLRNFTGSVSGPSYYSTVERRLLRSYWDYAVSRNGYNYTAIAAINGTFFDPKNNPTGIAFGLKADWWIMSYGYGVNEPGQKLTLAFNSSFGSSSIQPYKVDTFNDGIPNVIGGYDPWYNKDGRMNQYIPRTYVGVRDDNRDGHSETVMFFTSGAATQQLAIDTLAAFGAGDKMMLDGGSSTGLIVRGADKVLPVTSSKIPQAFIFYAGKQ